MIKSSSLALILIAACAIPISATAKNKHKHHAHKATAVLAAAKARSFVPQGQAYGLRDDVMQQAQAIADRQNLDPEWVRTTLRQAQYLPSIGKLMLPAPGGTAKNWRVYRSRFIDPIRIAAGVKFWQAHREWLQQAYETYGVPPEIVVGIIGVETIYGQNMGNFRVIDALATLAFDFPKAHPRAEARQAFFQAELEQFLSLSHRTGTSPFTARGSYAGAMGLGQFMPSSWAKYAIDFDGDGKVDLFNSAPDAIGSVANYFKAFNWQPGMPTHYPVRFDAAKLDMDALLAPDILPTFSAASLAAKGAFIDAADAPSAGPYALIELQNGPDAAQYVIGTDNFYAITRYNWSSYYAMAVIELGQAVSRALPKSP